MADPMTTPIDELAGIDPRLAPLSEEEESQWREALADAPSMVKGIAPEHSSLLMVTIAEWSDRMKRALATLDAARSRMDVLSLIYGPEDMAVAVKGPWRRERGVAASEEEHAIWLTNDAGDTLILNADDAATVINAILALAQPVPDPAEEAGR